MILLSLILSVSSLAFAHEGNDFKTVRCSEIVDDGQVPQYTLELDQIGRGRNYGLKFYQDSDVIVSDVVRVTTEDVMAFFDGSRSKVRIFMDELDQSSFYADGLEVRMNCDVQ